MVPENDRSFYWILFGLSIFSTFITVLILLIFSQTQPKTPTVSFRPMPTGQIAAPTQTLSPTVTGRTTTQETRQLTPTASPTQKPTSTETWVFKGYALGKKAGNEDALMVAMSEIIPLDDGRYRMYYGWAGKTGGTGIKSAVSTDAKTWQSESGFRLQGASDQNDREAVISGPSVVKLPDGKYRMYYQSSAMASPNEPPKYHVRSAISTDGVNFTREGIRIDIDTYDSKASLKMAGHGTYFIAADGTYVGIFSGNITDAAMPSDLVMATSKDGLTFGDFKKLYVSWHDPIVVKTSEGYKIYATYLLEKQGVAISSDGKNWPAEMTTVTFQDEAGNKLTEGNSGVGDLGGAVMPDGSIKIYANWGSSKVSEDIVYFEKQ